MNRASPSKGSTDELARSVFLEAFQFGLDRLTRRMGISWDDAEDIAATAIENVWRRAAADPSILAPRSAFFGYVAAAIDNTARNFARSHREYGDHDPDQVAEHPYDRFRLDPAARLEERERWRDVALAINALPRAEREAFLLAELTELERAEVARRLDVNPGSVTTYVARARKKLRVALAGLRRTINE